MTPQELSQRRVKELRAKAYYDMIAQNEGVKPNVYADSKGNRTIGIGFNLEDKANRKFLKEQGININELFNGRELNDKEIKTLYNQSLSQAYTDARKFDPKFDKRPEGVKMALTDMSFNLGLTKLNEFEKMKEALQKDDYRTAAVEAQDSDWFKQVKTRGPRTVSLFNK
jgi:GH24 family phage-related lysozyme (muramidase)